MWEIWHFIYHMEWVREMTSPHPYWQVGELDGPEVMRWGELSLSLSSPSNSIKERRPCTSPGQHNRADPADGAVGEQERQ